MEEIARENSLNIITLQEVSATWPRRTTVGRYQVVVSEQGNPRRTAVMWDMYRYSLLDCDSKGSNIIVQLQGIGYVISAYCPHSGRGDEDFAAALADTINKLDMQVPIIFAGDMNLEVFEDIKSNYLVQAHRFGELRRGVGGTEREAAFVAGLEAMDVVVWTSMPEFFFTHRHYVTKSESVRDYIMGSKSFQFLSASVVDFAHSSYHYMIETLFTARQDRPRDRHWDEAPPVKKCWAPQNPEQFKLNLADSLKNHSNSKIDDLAGSWRRAAKRCGRVSTQVNPGWRLRRAFASLRKNAKSVEDRKAFAKASVRCIRLQRAEARRRAEI